MSWATVEQLTKAYTQYIKFHRHFRAEAVPVPSHWCAFPRLIHSPRLALPGYGLGTRNSGTLGSFFLDGGKLITASRGALLSDTFSTAHAGTLKQFKPNMTLGSGCALCLVLQRDRVLTDHSSIRRPFSLLLLLLLLS